MVSFLDHGFLFGDSLYEVVRIYDGKFFAWDEHIQRFVRSGDRVGINIEALVPELLIRAKSILTELQEPQSALRIIVTRGVGKLHIDPRTCEKPSIYMAAWKLDVATFPTELSLIVAKIRRNPRVAMDPAIKSGNYLNSVLAFKEAAELGFDDAVMLNPEGVITELTTSNIGWIRNGEVHTPRVDTGILHGITRKFFLQHAKVVEGDYSEDDLKKADEVFALSTFKEVLPVTSIRFENGSVKKYPIGSKTRELQTSFRSLVSSILKSQEKLF